LQTTNYLHNILSYVYCDVIIKVVLGCFAVLIYTNIGFTYTDVTEACSLENNALNMRSCIINANFYNIAQNLICLWRR